MAEQETLQQDSDCPSTGITHKFEIGERTYWLTLGSKSSGEVETIDLVGGGATGSLVAGLAEALSKVMTAALRHGVPLLTLADTLEGLRFEPSGATGNPDLPQAKSPVDYVAKWLKLWKFTAATSEK